MSGRLILCGTPIGNLEDLSRRALETLQKADVVACEDPRRARKLLTHHGVRARELIVYNEGNERRQTGELLRRVARGDDVVLVSDAGMPGLSDPGYRLVRACADAGLPVSVVPGPTAAIAALAVSGLPSDRFAFEGFLPRKPGDRRRRIAELAAETRTMILYAPPHRVEEYLAQLLEGLGDRPAALARELTKLFEEVRRGRLSELLEGVRADPPRGEIVLLVGGVPPERPEAPAGELARRAEELMAAGVERREALTRVARERGVARRRVFDALVEERGR